MPDTVRDLLLPVRDLPVTLMNLGITGGELLYVKCFVPRNLSVTVGEPANRGSEPTCKIVTVEQPT